MTRAASRGRLHAVAAALIAAAVVGCARPYYGSATLSYASADVWRGITLSSQPVGTAEVSAATPVGTMLLAAGLYSSALMTRGNSDDITLSMGNAGDHLRSNGWLELSHEGPKATIALGVTRRLWAGRGEEPRLLPTATEWYLELSSAGGARPSQQMVVSARVTHDQTPGGATFALLSLDTQPLIFPMLVEIAGRIGTEIGVVLNTDPSPAGDLWHLERGIAYVGGSLGLTITPEHKPFHFFGDVSLRQNIDPSTRLVAQNRTAWLTGWIRAGMSVRVPGYSH